MKWILLVLLFASPILQADESEAAEMLAKAARSGDLKVIESLLSAGVSPDLPDQDGHAPIFYAASFNQTQAVELLLDNHANPNTPVGHHSIAPQPPATPLQYAAELGNRRVVSLLVEAGAHLNEPGPSGRTALHYALGHLDILQILLEKGADVDARDNEGTSALDEAVWYGLLDASAVLLAHGAGVNEAETKTGATPINEAAYKGQTKLVRYLLLFKPDLAIADKHGYGPLENAARMGKEDAAVMLAEAATPPAVFIRAMDSAVVKDEPRLVETLLQHGVAVNVKLPTGSTPLEAAVFHGAAKAAAVLLDAHADPNAAGANGSSPLEDAALKGFDAIVQMLLDHGASVDRINEDSGTTALYSAAAFGKGGVVKLLLKHGANPNLCGQKHKSPLAAAVENGYGDVATEIKESGGTNHCPAS